MSTDNRTIERESLTSAVYHLRLGIEYLEDFKRDCKQEAKYDAGRWVEMTRKALHSIYNAMTPESRERYKNELGADADVLFFPAISNKILLMNQAQRDTLEMAADGILSGEFVIEKVDENILKNQTNA